MCGIAGIYNFKSDIPVTTMDLESMISTIRHRGPDASGTVIPNHGVGLGNVRLSVIDLNPESNQPFMIDDNEFVISYNGEIFNYIELREELSTLGHKFCTKSDTEVVLRAYKEWGEEAVNRFNGMWAFAIYSRKQDMLFCSRDRFGIKPFYYVIHEGRLIFASEVKAIIAFDRRFSDPDYTKISRFLRSSIEAQNEDTFFKQVKKLKPACNMIVNKEGVKFRRYWNYPVDIQEDLDFEDAATQLRELLRDSLRLRMRSDVPVGITLSGGIDSSTLVCLLRTFSSSLYETFTAAFPDERIDESSRAASLSLELGMNFNKITILPKDEFLINLRRVVYHMDAPTHSPAVLPLWNIMKKMKEKVVVAIEGQGADELLAGYAAACFSAVFFDEIRNFSWNEAFCNLRWQIKTYGWMQTIMYALRVEFPSLHKLHRIIRGDNGLYNAEFKDIGSDSTQREDVPVFADHLTTRLYKYHTGGLRALLHYGDAISMAHSIESRLPFMDYRLVEFCFRLPGHMKFRNGHSKAVLKRAVRCDVPGWILNTRSKLGFATPIARWFRDYPDQLIYPVLFSQESRNRGIFDPIKLNKMLEKHRSGRADISQIIFRLIGIELWFQECIDSA